MSLTDPNSIYKPLGNEGTIPTATNYVPQLSLKMRYNSIKKNEPNQVAKWLTLYCKSFVQVSETTVNSAERRTARALALQALYELDCTDHSVEQVLPARLKQADPDPDPNLDLIDNAVEPSVKGKDGKNSQSKNGYSADTGEADSTSENRISADQRTFIYAIVNGVRNRRASIDLILQPYAEERPLTDIAIIDRNILRMAIYEFAIGQQTPLEAAINEAVELAKAFGADSAPRFVNGVLGAVADHETEVIARLATEAAG